MEGRPSVNISTSATHSRYLRDTKKGGFPDLHKCDASPPRDRLKVVYRTEFFLKGQALNRWHVLRQGTPEVPTPQRSFRLLTRCHIPNHSQGDHQRDPCIPNGRRRKYSELAVS